MSIKYRLINFYELCKHKFRNITNFTTRGMSLQTITAFLYRPVDPSSLGVSRILFGLAMFLDALTERGALQLMRLWGDPHLCHFPLLPGLVRAGPLPLMLAVYLIMLLGAIGVTVGYRFRLSASAFALTYWYILLIEKSYWNTHSYLFGLLAILYIGTGATNYMSVDSRVDSQLQDRPVPYWNYFIFKYQQFIMYFVAGMKKYGQEWPIGYSMTKHWVFYPFKLFLSSDQTDYLFVHWFACVFNLTAFFLMIYGRTRPVIMGFAVAYHYMISRIFAIGMSPWVCLSIMLLFCSFDWPKQIKRGILNKVKCHSIIRMGYIEMQVLKDEETTTDNGQDVTGGVDKTRKTKIAGKEKRVTILLFIYMALQAFLPFAHFITKGNTNSISGPIGYTWDIAFNPWKLNQVTVKVVDNNLQNEYFLAPQARAPNNMWTLHADLAYQYAKCLEEELAGAIDFQNDMIFIGQAFGSDTFISSETLANYKTSRNISIYIDVSVIIDERYEQRVFDPRVDLLKAKWSPFGKIDWVMPLLTEFNDWNRDFNKIINKVQSWNKYFEVMFHGDFPGMSKLLYIPHGMVNVTMTVLYGHVKCETSLDLYDKPSSVMCLTENQTTSIAPGSYHRVYTIGDQPSFYMYIFERCLEERLAITLTKMNT